MTGTEGPHGGGRSKPTLFCPTCGHESRVDGDWVVVESAAATRFVCPVCEATLTRRPRDGFDCDDVDRDDHQAGLLTAWARCWRSWGRVLSSWQRASRVVASLA